MVPVKSYFTIEQHLEEVCAKNKVFEILNSVWKLNKSNLTNALSTVAHVFPHYSQHDHTHSETIISNIESFLGEERIRNLSPTDAWLILMAAFTHDLGMIAFSDVVEGQWQSEEFGEYLEQLLASTNVDLKSSAELMLRLKAHNEGATKSAEQVELNPLEIKSAVTLLTAEYIRRIHHRRSSDALKGVDAFFHRIASAFYSDQIPQRLINVLGEVAFLHGAEFYEIIKRLDRRSNGFANDKIHPRFIAAMLRLGDLLDVDDKRFNRFLVNVHRLPEDSKAHQAKHSSIKHLLVSPNDIEITADCGEEEVYRLARSWFDWLENEAELQSREWSNIAPDDLGGAAPRIAKGKIKVVFNGSVENDALLNLRFTVANEKIFEILEGASIYKDAHFTFLRELVQNAVDASKIQLWKDIISGTHDYALQQKLGLPNADNAVLVQKIKFPQDLPEHLLKSFGAHLKVTWEKDTRELVFSVSDRGTGITDETLIAMTSRVGESSTKTKALKKFIKSMPFWLKPTAAFGVGLQSVFIIVDTFTVVTKADGEPSKQIIFRSARKGSYSSAQNDPSLKQRRGTEVTIRVPESEFKKVFGRTFSWDIVHEYDYFSSRYESIYMPKVRQYITSILSNVRGFEVDFLGEDVLTPRDNSVKNNEVWHRHGDAFTSDNGSVQCIFLTQGFNLIFSYYESEVGSQFWLSFFGDAKIDIAQNWPAYKTMFRVRDIPVDDNLIHYNRLSYAQLTWNFMSPESDQILSLSREKLIGRKRPEIESLFLDHVVPEALDLASKSVIGHIEELRTHFSGEEQKLEWAIFKLELSRRVNGLLESDLLQFLDKGEISEQLCTDQNDTPLNMERFLSSERLIVPELPSSIQSESGMVREKKNLISEMKKAADPSLDMLNGVVIWKERFFTPYVRGAYYIETIAWFEKGRVFFLRRKPGNSQKLKLVDNEQLFWKTLIPRKDSNERKWQYCPSHYFETLGVANHYITGFENFPFLSDTSLISPFVEWSLYNSLREELRSKLDSGDPTQIAGHISDERARSFVSDKLIEWVIQHGPKEVGPRTVEGVLSSYKELIAQILVADNSGDAPK